MKIMGLTLEVMFVQAFLLGRNRAHPAGCEIQMGSMISALHLGHNDSQPLCPLFLSKIKFYT
ncbi:MAG: hypothetical protein A3C79_01005 [Candidatus Taylorbacteria bacterium RIFCSPHIGHO2_02_FULL_45_28]|uniref:Uncharacterized protein n=1 Tax=Candidatus Taylorbacteria bacterium RIFCSPHIGHO2_12_FULL_45_16 TaxID=1802315 RepID=A0A1G2MZ85_9BACT|nr:MAG: hypothetical protein A3C79_01005 [Candidatus Taylorbacteria bacterium RIFCSPHIGHO2_02_FULL_45_28]OHA29265.1 MAG: hypothetical protein A3F51_01470 [Candidatus Taylorbacteria bacterium RIFCSPHIGHO2_12_FULL_45_16]OHA33487.1 MAG: hypothetical protein A3A23_02350 [Candidatus Taylorbacteria bacterium RIFCSPLOWO2_01_FULL_45_59]